MTKWRDSERDRATVPCGKMELGWVLITSCSLVSQGKSCNSCLLVNLSKRLIDNIFCIKYVAGSRNVNLERTMLLLLVLSVCFLLLAHCHKILLSYNQPPACILRMMLLEGFLCVCGCVGGDESWWCALLCLHLSWSCRFCAACVQWEVLFWCILNCLYEIAPSVLLDIEVQDWTSMPGRACMPAGAGSDIRGCRPGRRCNTWGKLPAPHIWPCCYQSCFEKRRGEERRGRGRGMSREERGWRESRERWSDSVGG